MQSVGLALLEAYALVCIVWTAAMISKNFKTMRDETCSSSKHHDLFLIGTIIAVLASPIWLPILISKHLPTIWRKIKENFKEEKTKRGL